MYIYIYLLAHFFVRKIYDFLVDDIVRNKMEGTVPYDGPHKLAEHVVSSCFRVVSRGIWRMLKIACMCITSMSISSAFSSSFFVFSFFRRLTDTLVYETRPIETI